MLGTVLRTWEEIQDHLCLGSLIGKMKKKKKKSESSVIQFHVKEDLRQIGFHLQGQRKSALA